MKPAMALLAVLAVALVQEVTAGSFADGYAHYRAASYDKAFDIFKPLADAGDAKAQAALAIMHEQGQGVPVDKAKALKWLKQAAKQGIAIAQHDLGVKYYQGKDVPRDHEKAFLWWRRAAENGIVQAQFNVGLSYVRGLGQQRDDTKARQWFQKAARQGYAPAAYALGVMYAHGQGVEINYKKAAYWFQKAATQGLAEAQYNLAALIESGKGRRADLELAKSWYKQAAENGLQQAIQKVSALTPRPPELTAAGKTKNRIKREAWILAQDPEHFTVQLATSPDEKGVIRFLKTERFDADVGYFRLDRNGMKTQYVVLYGIFPTQASAEQALARLPSHLMQARPVARRFQHHQKLIKALGQWP